MKNWLKENEGLVFSGILIFLFVVLPISYAIFQEYLDVKMKWNLAHIKNCPCLVEVQK